MPNTKHFIYSYRLTYFGGTAPCYDDNRLSLAICKRDMRRVMGRGFKADKEKKLSNKYWFIGIVGKGLADSADSAFKNDANSILYVAELSDVVDYADYFSDKQYRKRSDCIYEEASERIDCSYPKEGDRFFKHVEKNISNVHIEPMLQDRDWDIVHGSRETYVLISDKYSFIDKNKSCEIKKAVNQCNGKLANGVGHTYFEVSGDSPIIALLEGIVENKKEHHGIKNLPVELQKMRASGCGKDKA